MNEEKGAGDRHTPGVSVVVVVVVYGIDHKKNRMGVSLSRSQRDSPRSTVDTTTSSHVHKSGGRWRHAQLQISLKSLARPGPASMAVVG